jgi:Arc/MetJ-type ribon-helix-helix transcriptional regulator
MNGNLTEERERWERDQREYDAKLTRLQSAIDAGDASGTFDGDPFEGLLAGMRRHRTAAE